jgi:serine/threonine protein kinase
MPLAEGDRISNYLLEAKVGAGSFGEVWRARHHVFGDIVAIKIPTDREFVRNLQREGVAVHGLRHPNIVRVLDLDPYGDPPYMIMEYIDGPSLREAIDRHRPQFPVESAVAVLRGIMRALSVAHEAGLVHRDIKPENILLNHPIEKMETITERAVRITDFGLGRVGGAMAEAIMQSGSVTTQDGRSITGTIAYMSPEQKEGLDIDARSDLYSCAIVFHEMLTGDRPQGGDVPSTFRPEVPATLDEVFRRCYTRWDRRFASASEVLAALAGFGDVRGAPFPPPPAACGTGLCCPACHAGVQRSDNFCITCGHQLVASVPRCRQCGEFVQASDRYCIKCGKSLTVLI